MKSGYRSIPEGIILTLITCGIYNLFWNWRQMETCNELVGRREFAPGTVFLLSLVTCGLYFVYSQYCMGGVIVEIQRKREVAPYENLPLGRLDFAGAFAHNPLVFPLAALLMLCAAGRIPRILRCAGVVNWALLGVLVFWCGRLLPGTP